jgi:hypothetical protein
MKYTTIFPLGELISSISTSYSYIPNYELLKGLKNRQVHGAVLNPTLKHNWLKISHRSIYAHAVHLEAKYSFLSPPVSVLIFMGNKELT